MLLHELNLSPKPTTTDIHRKYNELRNPVEFKTGRFDDNHEHLGSGAFAHAHSSKSEPGTAVKVAKPMKDLESDGYFLYISALSQHKEGTNNRYFPVIYNVDVYEDPNSGEFNPKYTYSVDMERLQSFPTLSTEELLVVGNHIFNNFESMIADNNESSRELVRLNRRRATPKTDIRVKRNRDGEYSETYHIACQDAILTGVSAALRTRRSTPATFIKDPEFKRALIVLRSLFKSNKNIVSDIHLGNIMVRRGPFIPQLVLTDPVV